MNTRTVILFGGSFNPPHVAHLAIAEAAADSVQNSRVLWMPAATPPHKQGDPGLASAEDRLAMTRLATAGNSRFEVSDLEIERGEVSFTVETLRLLQDAYLETDLALLIGGDSLVEFSTWREPEAILKMVRLLVYRRGAKEEHRIPEWVRDSATLLDAPQLALSSTMLRAWIRANRSVRYLVADEVVDYVREQRLYI